jgi:hypothetical protein
VRLPPSFHHLVDGFAGVHGKGAHKYLLATAGAMIRPIEVLGDFIDPLFFLGAIWTSSSLSPEEDEPDSFMTPVL